MKKAQCGTAPFFGGTATAAGVGGDVFESSGYTDEFGATCLCVTVLPLGQGVRGYAGVVLPEIDSADVIVLIFAVDVAVNLLSHIFSSKCSVAESVAEWNLDSAASETRGQQRTPLVQRRDPPTTGSIRSIIMLPKNRSKSFIHN